MIMNALKKLSEPMTFIMLALLMVLILKYLLTVLRLLPLILMFQRKIRTNIMRLIKILLVIFLLQLLKFVLLIVSWFLRHVCHEGYLKAIERGDRRSGAWDGDRQGLPRFTSSRWRIATSCYNSL
jgi:hypothetical protein